MRYDRETVIDALRILAPMVEVARYALDIIERNAREIESLKQQRLELMADLEATRAMLDAAAAGQETLQKALAKADRCVSCGDVIPEGRQVCTTCENAKGETNDTSK